MDYKDIINNKVAEFIQEINYLCTKNNRRVQFEYFKYSIFDDTVDNYYKYADNEKYKEHYIEKILIFDTLRELMKQSNIHCYFPQENYKYPIAPIYKDKIDKRYDFLFIIDNVGYRLSYDVKIPISTTEKFENKTFKDEFLYLLEKYNIEKIKIINFDKNNHYSDAFIWCKDFFSQYLNITIWEYYDSSVKDAIRYSNNKMGYTTIKNLSFENLVEFKIRKIYEVKTMNFTKNKYLFKKNQNRSLPADDLKIINDNFNSTYNALFGNMSFAKCFITSEFLYENIKNQNNFDYTSVICGYIKTIEAILTFYYDSLGENKYEISITKINKCEQNIQKYKKKEIPYEILNSPYSKSDVVIKGFKECEHLELNDLFNYILYDDRYWLISKEALVYLKSVFTDFRKYCRNEYFHTCNINIDNYDEVERIRTNTLMCLFYILGGFKLLNNYKFDSYNYKYSILYSRINSLPCSIFKYEILIDNKKYLVIRPMVSREIEYNKESAEIESTIDFIIVTDFKNSYSIVNSSTLDGYNILTLSSQHMPYRIYWFDARGDKHLIDYDLDSDITS